MTTRSAHREPTRWLRIGIPVLLALIWLAAGSLGGPYFGKVGDVSTNDRSTFLPESADATQVNERLADFLGEDSIPAVLVVTGDGELTDDEVADVQAVVDDIAELDAVAGDVSPPIPSEDGEAVPVFVPLDASGEVRETVDEIRALAAEDLSDLQVWVTGPAGFTADLVEGFLSIDGLLLAVALIAVFVILVIVYRSPLLPVLVLATSVFALCAALLTVWWLAYAGLVVLTDPAGLEAVEELGHGNDVAEGGELLGDFAQVPVQAEDLLDQHDAGAGTGLGEPNRQRHVVHTMGHTSILTYPRSYLPVGSPSIAAPASGLVIVRWAAASVTSAASSTTSLPYASRFTMRRTKQNDVRAPYWACRESCCSTRYFAAA